MLGKRKRDTVVVRRQHATSDAVEDFNSGHYPHKADSGVGRKVQSNLADDDDDDNDDDIVQLNDKNLRRTDNAHSIFRKYFESHFDPLPNSDSNTPSLEQDREDDDTSDDGKYEGNTSAYDNTGRNNHKQKYELDDFTGFSDSEGSVVPVVEVIEDTAQYPGAGRIRRSVLREEGGDSIDRIFKKDFMTSKPPRDAESSSTTKQSTDKSKMTNKDNDNDAYNLKNDIDLQRLLRESHLLSQSRTASDPTMTTLQGRQRHQAADLRLMDLGSRSSVFAQEKMPMSHRKGIYSKASAMEERRRREAKENGIVLENPTGSIPGSHRSEIRRDRGVDVPALGKFKGGTLSLSKRDIASIQGPSAKGGRLGRRGGGGGKKRGRR